MLAKHRRQLASTCFFPSSSSPVACDSGPAVLVIVASPWGSSYLNSCLLGLHNPKGPCTRMYIHWPQCTYKGTTLRPKYILFWVHGPFNPIEPLRYPYRTLVGTLKGSLFGYMEPWGNIWRVSYDSGYRSPGVWHGPRV